MAVKIRLKRMGKRKQPSYRVVVADSRAPRDGRIIELLGRYDPRQDPSLVEIDNERAQYWLSSGAQPTDRVKKLLEISGAVARAKVSRSGVYRLDHDEPEKKVEPAAEEAVEVAAQTPAEAADDAVEDMPTEEMAAAEAETEQPEAAADDADVKAEADETAEAAEEKPEPPEEQAAEADDQPEEETAEEPAAETEEAGDEDEEKS